MLVVRPLASEHEAAALTAHVQDEYKRQFGDF
jgi:hypothetical protein